MLLVLIFSVFISIPSHAQLDSFDKKEMLPSKDSTFRDSVVTINAINIVGNQKTKSYIILREIPFKTGDSLTFLNFTTNLKQAHDQVYNMTLFEDVIITPLFVSSSKVIITVVVKEKWYIYPTPQFQLVDRNLNEWIKVYNANLSRVIYGAKFAHYNFSGRRDQLRVYILNGYARNFSFSYSAPYSNSALTEGFAVAASFTQNREVAYKTTYFNKLLQYHNNYFVRNVFSVSGGYTVRKGFFKRHAYSIGYTLLNVNDSLLTPRYNPLYYNSLQAHKSYVDFGYGFQYANTNNINYPLQGSVYGISALKRGLGFTGGVNMLMLDAYVNKYIDHNRNWYSSFEFNGKIKAPFNQPYINQRALGYSNFYLRGLEYYVIDGAAAAVVKYTLRKKLLSFDLPLPVKIKSFSKIPFNIYAKTFADVGYSYIQPQYASRLNNRLLYSGGFGLDLLTLYDINLRLEYSFNQLNEKGLFLHARGGF